MKKTIHAFRREINRLLYLNLICHHAPKYEGPLQPFSLRDLQALQLYGENAKAWKLLHGHWRQRQLQTDAAWSDQVQRNIELTMALFKEIARKPNCLGFKAPLLRKLAALQRLYRWQLKKRNRDIRRREFLRETGLGNYFYKMHRAGLKWQIS